MAYVRSIDGFSEDAVAAMQTAPAYFAFYYTAKSLALVAVIALFAYHLGSHSKR